MRAYELTSSGTAYALRLVDRPTPEPGPGQVRVRVRATSLNYRDLVVKNNLAGRPAEGLVPVSDGAGEVEAVGPGVSAWTPGDRVAGIFFQGWVDGPFDMAYHRTDLGGSVPGMLAEQVVLGQDGLVRVPDHLSFEEAATLPCAAVTVWQALVRRGGLRAGQTVLALGTGGVSIFALQFAAALGARVIITSSSDEKLARARELGAAETVNYRTTPDWDKEVLRLTGKLGVDHVVEVGGPGTLGKSVNSVRAGGHVALIGVLSGFGPSDASLFPLVARNAQVSGIYVGSRRDFEEMNRFLELRQLRPVIDRTFALADAPAAYDHLQSGAHFGKVVVRHD